VAKQEMVKVLVLQSSFVDETAGVAWALFETAGVALAVGLALGVGEAACADESKREEDVIAAISKFRFTLCSI